MRTDRNARRVQALEAHRPAKPNPWDEVLAALDVPALKALKALCIRYPSGHLDAEGDRELLAILEAGAPDGLTFQEWRKLLANHN